MIIQDTLEYLVAVFHVPKSGITSPAHFPTVVSSLFSGRRDSTPEDWLASQSLVFLWREHLLYLLELGIACDGGTR